MFDLVKVCFIFSFEKPNIILIKHHLNIMKNTKEEGKKIQLEPERLLLYYKY